MSMEAKVKGVLFKGLKRKMTGESFSLTEVTPEGGYGFVEFAGNAPGTIKAIELTEGKDFIAQKDAFLCAESGIDLDITFQKRLSAAFFGGEGIFVTTLTGPGNIILQSMILGNLASALRQFMPGGGSSGTASSGFGIAGKLLGG